MCIEKNPTQRRKGAKDAKKTCVVWRNGARALPPGLQEEIPLRMTGQVRRVENNPVPVQANVRFVSAGDRSRTLHDFFRLDFLCVLGALCVFALDAAFEGQAP